jgi:hypothetical protein
MDVQKSVCFVSKARYLNVQKYPGYTIQKAVPGGSTAVNEPAEFVRFKDHRILTNSPEIIEFLRKVAKERPQLGIREIKEKTKEELYQEEMAKLKEQVDRVKKMKDSLPPTEEEKKEEEGKFVDSAKEISEPKTTENPFKCWICGCSQTVFNKPIKNERSLAMHIRKAHGKNLKISTIKKRLAENK